MNAERPGLTCCTAIRRPFPSGLAWAHSDSCTVARGQKVTESPTSGVLSPVEARKHAARASARHDLSTALTHEPGCLCGPSCQYLEAHADDTDDDGEMAL